MLRCCLVAAAVGLAAGQFDWSDWHVRDPPPAQQKPIIPPQYPRAPQPQASLIQQQQQQEQVAPLPTLPPLAPKYTTLEAVVAIDGALYREGLLEDVFSDVLSRLDFVVNASVSNMTWERRGLLAQLNFDVLPDRVSLAQRTVPAIGRVHGINMSPLELPEVAPPPAAVAPAAPAQQSPPQPPQQQQIAAPERHQRTYSHRFYEKNPPWGQPSQQKFQVPTRPRFAPVRATPPARRAVPAPNPPPPARKQRVLLSKPKKSSTRTIVRKVAPARPTQHRTIRRIIRRAVSQPRPRRVVVRNGKIVRPGNKSVLHKRRIIRQKILLKPEETEEDDSLEEFPLYQGHSLVASGLGPQRHSEPANYEVVNEALEEGDSEERDDEKTSTLRAATTSPSVFSSANFEWLLKEIYDNGVAFLVFSFTWATFLLPIVLVGAMVYFLVKTNVAASKWHKAKSYFSAVKRQPTTVKKQLQAATTPRGRFRGNGMTPRRMIGELGPSAMSTLGRHLSRSRTEPIKTTNKTTNHQNLRNFRR